MSLPDHHDNSSAAQAAHRRLYHGLSMSPTFKPADVLHVVPCTPGSTSVGDVVIFKPEKGGTPVVHRVVAINGQRLTTRGDANADSDPRPIPWDRILGKVTYADGLDGVRPIHGGIRGRVAASLVGARIAAARAMSRILHRPYMLLAETRVFQVLRPALPQLAAVAFQREDGIELRLFLGRIPIGRLPPTRDRWIIRRPFRLIVDGETLARLVRNRRNRVDQHAKSD